MKTRKTQYYDAERRCPVYGFEFNDGVGWLGYSKSGTAKFIDTFDSEIARDEALKEFKKGVKRS